MLPNVITEVFKTRDCSIVLSGQLRAQHGVCDGGNALLNSLGTFVYITD